APPPTCSAPRAAAWTWPSSTRRCASSSGSRSAPSRRSATGAPRCCWTSRTRTRRPTTRRGRSPAAPRMARWPRRWPSRTSTTPLAGSAATPSRCTAASASRGNTTCTSTSSARRRSSRCTATPSTTASSSSAAWPAEVAVADLAPPRPGVADRLGVGEAGLRALNPRLIYCSTTAFGSTGPFVDRPGFDPVLQGMAGIMALQGFGGPPQYIRVALVDYYAAALTAQAVLAALFVRERSGVGQKVETSLLHAVTALQAGNFVDYPGKQSVFRDNPTYRLYPAAD